VIADADRNGASHLFMLGPDELARGVVKQRELGTGEEREEKIADFAPGPPQR
jgi:histidyl-tRNA synthetase